MEFTLSAANIKEQGSEIIVESAGHEGIRDVAGWLRRDIGNVFGVEPGIVTVEHEEVIKDHADLEEARSAVTDAALRNVNPIICVSADKGYLAQGLDDRGVIDLDAIRGKRECYIFKVVELDAPSNEEGKNGKAASLLIIGSDKRGTIYGMLHLSELLGVSPLTDWMDVKPVHKDRVTITEADNMISKEPSVEYRGFFINDEWPAFGNWCNKRFGGFNAECYAHVFELLLRLKGNYMWPAMWSSIFPEDGPGLASAELADKLGVIMGMSHHEPCLRQGEEYKYLRGPGSIYGDAWDFRRNKEGITRFWEDGLKRGGHLENVITVGMRGEFDSTVLGKEATLGDNIELIRDVLKTQNELIRRYVDDDLTKVPRMIALYKEVEAFYYGDETYKGLQGEPELDGVTLMLCDDNFGNLRTVPPVDERDHNGGWGMYYHMDYHGWPISHEWVNSNYLPKIWEQMTAAYEFGIRKLWIVNVGDIFTNEYPLSFFLDLAYDYEKWGASNLDAPSEYTKAFVRTQFPGLTDHSRAAIEKLLKGYTKIASNRRPEAMNTGVYDPVWYGETEDLLDKCDGYMEETDRLYKELSDISSGVYDTSVITAQGVEAKDQPTSEDPFYELVYYPLMANLNIQKMWLYTGLNHSMADVSASDEAARYADLVNECLREDERIVNELHEFHDGMWYGMGLSKHIGFKYWCEEECAYPVLYSTKRPDKPRILTCIPGTDRHTEGNFWTKSNLVLDTFLRPDAEAGIIRLYSTGSGSMDYVIEGDTDAFDISSLNGSLKCGEYRDIEISLGKDGRARAGLEADSNGCRVYVLNIGSPKGHDQDESIRLEAEIRIPVNTRDYSHLPKGTFIWCGLDKTGQSSPHYTVLTDEKCLPMGYISIEAAHFTGSHGVEGAVFKEMEDYGRTLSGIKVFPVTNSYAPGEDAPFVDYKIHMEEAGSYRVDVYVTPANPVYKNNMLRYGIQVISAGEAEKAENIQYINTVASDYSVGDDKDEWKTGVLDNIRINPSLHEFMAGLNTLRIYACDPGLVVQKIVIYKKDERPARSYLGPVETYRTL